MMKQLGNGEAQRYLRRLKQHYDKLLHVSVTFMMMALLCKMLPAHAALATTLMAQLAKTALNRVTDDTYKPWGDWLANAAGYAVYTMFLAM